jgi:hypothetical protein
MRRPVDTTFLGGPKTGLDREKFDFPAAFGSVREGLGTCSGHVKTVMGDLGGRRLSSARRNARAARSRNHCRIRPAARKGRILRRELKDGTLTPSDGVNHGFMFEVGVVDKAGGAMSEAREWPRHTPTSATSENENAAGCRGDEPAYFDNMARGVRNSSARRRIWIASGKSRCIRVCG